jgi:hypothetical protein
MGRRWAKLAIGPRHGLFKSRVGSKHPSAVERLNSLSGSDVDDDALAVDRLVVNEAVKERRQNRFGFSIEVTTLGLEQRSGAAH